MNILNKQIDSIYDRQKNLYSKYPHYSQQNAESKKVCEQEKITATSGKDVLGITKGDKENSYIVHFSDSAMVSRAVARGYVTVNGKEVELTEDTKQQLSNLDAAYKKTVDDFVTMETTNQHARGIIGEEMNKISKITTRSTLASAYIEEQKTRGKDEITENLGKKMYGAITSFKEKYTMIQPNREQLLMSIKI